MFVGGDGATRYRYPDGIESVWSTSRPALPDEVQDALPGFLKKRLDIAAQNKAVVENRELIRIDDYSFPLRNPDDAPWPIRLHVSKTFYHQTLATNYSSEELLPGGFCLREKYCTDVGDLKGSILANALSVNLSVVTGDNKILMAIRGRRVAVNPSRGPGYSPAISGTAQSIDLDQNGRYSPFLTAIREAGEEVRSQQPKVDQITFFGLARTMRWQFPFLFGELRLPDLSAVQVQGLLPRDHWESAGFVVVPFRPEAIIDFVRRVYRETDRNNITHSTIYAALFSILQSVRYEYPDVWTDMVKELAEVQARD